MLIPSKVTRVWSWTSKRHKNAVKVTALPIPAICAFLCLFDVQLQTLVTFEGINIFTIPWPKVPLSFPAPKRECGIFGPFMMKNRIRNMGIKRATPEHMFAASPSARVLIYMCSGLTNSLPSLLCNKLFLIFKKGN